MSDSAPIFQVQQALNRPLTHLESTILEGAWEGVQYRVIAEQSGYGEEYLKQIGAKLWHDLSSHLEVAVTKKNLRIVLQNWLYQLEANPEGCPLDRSYGFPSGPLSPNSSLYIHRPPAETIAFSAIDQPGCLLCIHAPHRYGKTSMLRRLMTYAQSQVYRVCLLDLQEADSQTLRQADLLLPWLCHRMADGLGLASPEEAWNPRLGVKVNCGRYLQQVVLEQAETPFVLAIHALEVGLGQVAVAQDLLSMLHLWHERAQGTPLWQRLRLVLVYATDSPTVLAHAPSHPLLSRVAPLNLGRSVGLPPLSPHQFATLGRRYQLALFHDSSQQSAVDSLYDLIAGHPYLAHLSCYALKQGQHSLDDMVSTAVTPDSVFWPHLQNRLNCLQHYPQAKEALRRVVLGDGVQVDGVSLDQLLSLGLVQVVEGLVYPLGDIYRYFFATYLIDEDVAVAS
ncbi:MAG: AAA-like domain-containing protein [Leptolyngbya sp.]|nr:AAA-like domain-containing protein [Leptolyngbya sp.]